MSNSLNAKVIFCFSNVCVGILCYNFNYVVSKGMKTQSLRHQNINLLGVPNRKGGQDGYKKGFQNEMVAF